ncbi:MAG: AMP-binding protein [Clostridia bacterium]|nr:AMP-binding protein [Clostridia bacterium]
MTDYPLNKTPHIENLKELVNLRTAMPNEIAFMYKKKKEIVKVTAEQFKTDIQSFGAYLYGSGIKNSKVALIGENSYRWILSYFAVVNGGNIIVPIDKELSDEDIADLIKQSGANALIYADTYSDIAESHKDLKLFNMNDFDEYIAKGNELTANGNTDFIDYEIDNEKLCSIIYTSGTTGKPKGVMLSHKSFAADIISSCENVYIAGQSMLTLPLNHTFAFSTSVLSMLLKGVTISINSSLRTFKQDLKDFKPQNMFLVPLYVETMYKNIWTTAEEQGKDRLLKTMLKISNALRRVGIDIRRKVFKSVLDAFGGELDLIVSGGAPINEQYIKCFDELGITVLNGYGITECAPVVAVNRNKAPVKDSVGLVLSCNEIKEKDGEILVRGDNVMLGYYEDESATKDAFEDGWFKTGDLGYIENNHLFITGRKKNLIILSNGKNVSPEELEEKIQRIENVIEVLVYSENDIITAEIYAENTENIKEKINELNKTLPLYKQVQNIKFRDTEFNKTTTKKIKR